MNGGKYPKNQNNREHTRDDHRMGKRTGLLAGAVFDDVRSKKMPRYTANCTGSQRNRIDHYGSKESGISAHIRGWSVGIKVKGRPALVGLKSQDRFVVRLSGGSRHGKVPHCGMTVTEDAGKLRITYDFPDGTRRGFVI